MRARKDFRRAEVQVPYPNDNGHYRAHCLTTGEVLVCHDLAPLFRRIANSMFDAGGQWTVSWEPADSDPGWA